MTRQSWDNLKRDLGFTLVEQAEISAGAQRLIAEARAYRLSEVLRRQHTHTGGRPSARTAVTRVPRRA